MRSAFALVAALVLMSACTEEQDRGGFGNPPPPIESPSPVPVETAPDEPARVLRVSAPGGLRFEPQALAARAGELIEIELSNQDDQEHTFVVSELAVVLLAGAGQTVRSRVAIDPGNTGRFAFFCSISDHRARGMKGTISVRAG